MDAPNQENVGGSVDAAMDLELWKYFEDRVVAVRQSFINVVTIIFGAAAAIISFTAQNVLGGDSSDVVKANAPLLIVVSAAGLALMGFAIIVIRDTAIHLQISFGRAERAAENSPRLRYIIGRRANSSKAVKPAFAPLADLDSDDTHAAAVTGEPPEQSKCAAPRAVWQTPVCRQSAILVACFAIVFLFGIIMGIVSLLHAAA